jgi:hypothetical protein
MGDLTGPPGDRRSLGDQSTFQCTVFAFHGGDGLQESLGEPPQNLRQFGDSRGSGVPLDGPGLADLVLGPLGPCLGRWPLLCLLSAAQYGFWSWICVFAWCWPISLLCMNVVKTRSWHVVCFHHFGLCFYMFSCTIHRHANIHQHLWNLLV